MKDEKKSKLKFLPLAAVLIFAIVMVTVVKRTEGTVTIHTVLRYTPENLYLAMAVLLGLFALKSLSVVLPLSVLYLASGILFSPVPAVLVSAAGLWITITIPYLIGYFCGKEIYTSMLAKYPKIEKIAMFQSENTFFMCFITRIAGFLPADILSLYFGFCRIPYGVYALAGVTGSLLSIVTTTLLGNKLEDPFSREFMIILIIRIALVVVSFVIRQVVSLKKHGTA